MERRTLLLAGLLLVLGAYQAASAPASAGTSNPLPCDCTDVDARIGFIEPVNYTCWEQYKFGKCNEDFMKQTIKEIQEGYCQISCNRCTCCPTFAKAAESAGLTEFLWAVNRTAGVSGIEALDQPGLMVTLLAPNNGAMADLFAKLGGKARIQSSQDLQKTLADVLKLHVLPEIPDLRATWTAPFFQPGTDLPTLNTGAALKVAEGGRITAPKSSARVSKADIYACKGFIQEIDAVLLPYEVTQS